MSEPYKKTLKQFTILTFAQILIFVLFVVIDFLVLRFFEISLVELGNKNIFFLLFVTGLYFFLVVRLAQRWYDFKK